MRSSSPSSLVCKPSNEQRGNLLFCHWLNCHQPFIVSKCAHASLAIQEAPLLLSVLDDIELTVNAGVMVFCSSSVQGWSGRGGRVVISSQPSYSLERGWWVGWILGDSTARREKDLDLWTNVNESKRILLAFSRIMITLELQVRIRGLLFITQPLSWLLMFELKVYLIICQWDVTLETKSLSRL